MRLVRYLCVGLAIVLGYFTIIASSSWLISCLYDPYPAPLPAGTNDADATLATGSLSYSTPLPTLPDNVVAQHPFLVADGHNGTHADAYSSGTYKTSGPMGDNPIVNSAIPVDYWLNKTALKIGGEGVTQTFSSDGTVLYTRSIGLGVDKLVALDITDNFKRIGVLTGVSRVNPGETLKQRATDSSGGVYFHIIDDDTGNGDQILTANGEEHIQIITPTPTSEPIGNACNGQMVGEGCEPISCEGQDYGFTIAEDYDVKASLQVTGAVTNASKLTDVMIDWNHKNLIWFISNDGTVGLLNRSTGSVEVVELTSVYNDPYDDPDLGDQTINERFWNSIAMDASGLYVVSDFALYRFSANNANGGINQDWRTVNYGRGGDASGTFGTGSGSTPTAFGPDYIAITDFSNPINVNVYSRATGTELCSEPVFDVDKSSTENSLIGYYNNNSGVGSIIVENNFGYALTGDGGLPNNTVPVPQAEPGVARVNINASGVCSKPWEVDISSPSSILKLSTGNGIVYIYEPEYLDSNGNGETTADEVAWYLTGLNFDSGEPVFRAFTGTGIEWNVNYAAISIGPDGKAYIGTVQGLVSVED